jgi:DNA-binding NarL/FixJ family response regulator
MKVNGSILTKEERDVLILAAPHPDGQHLSNTEIGQRLGISLTKVKTLIRQACVKLNAHNRYEAGVFAIQQGEIKLDEVYSLNELAEIFSSIHPDKFRGIAHLAYKEADHRGLPINDEQKNGKYRRQDAVLTRCEQDVLKLVGRGLTNKEIANALYITTSTVRSFLYRACTKLGAHTRVEAVVLALKLGEISFDEIYSLNEFARAFTILEAESIEQVAQLLTGKFEQ